MNSNTTVVLTSCKRHDLLAKTLSTFRAFNTDVLTGDVLVIEDGDGDPSDICNAYGAKLIRTEQRIGQLAAIDLAYSQIKTPFIFHCEDDWEFYRSGFMERSRTILETDPSTMCIWLRAWNDTNGHPLSYRSSCRTFGVLAKDYILGENVWHGFTFNPSLRRTSDYLEMGAYRHALPAQNLSREADIGVTYHKRGLRAVILDETGYVRHLGGGRSAV